MMTLPPLKNDVLLHSTILNISAETEAFRRDDPNISGYRFLYSSKESFSVNCGLMLAGINPGHEDDMSDRGFTADGRNAYRTEAWKGPKFQPQMVHFMRALFRDLRVPDVEFEKYFDSTLTSNLTPFRSRRFKNLSPESQQRAITFGVTLWSTVLPDLGIRAIICCGDDCYNGFKEVRRRVPDLNDLTLVQITHASSAHWNLDNNLRHAKGVLDNAKFLLSPV